MGYGCRLGPLFAHMTWAVNNGRLAVYGTFKKPFKYMRVCAKSEPRQQPSHDARGENNLG
jgi:hypothetical protein